MTFDTFDVEYVHMNITNYNRIYGGMFSGSLYGAGAVKIAVWAYVLSQMKPSRKDGEFYVELNPRLLADCIGEEHGDVLEAVEALREPDESSRSKDDDGRRLVQVGQFLHRVVNGRKYQQFEFTEKKRVYQRVWQANKRATKKAAIQERGVNPAPGQSIKAAINEKIKAEYEADRKALQESPAFHGEPLPQDAADPGIGEEL